MPGALAPPAGAEDPAGGAGKDVSSATGFSTAGGLGGGAEVTGVLGGVVGDVGAGRRFPGSGVVFCCVPGAGAADPEADDTGTAVSAVPDPGDTEEEEP